jgi:hypothetical protein
MWRRWRDDVFSATEDALLTVTVDLGADNDTDTNGDPLSALIVSAPPVAQGSLRSPATLVR